MRKKYREYDEGRGLRAAGRRRGRRGGRVCGSENPEGNEKDDEKAGASAERAMETIDRVLNSH